jgi:hypothetical protein
MTKGFGVEMKQMIFAAAMLLASTAQADMIRQAFVNLQCQDAQGAVINLKTTVSGSELAINGQVVATGGPLSAATEGGPPYLQFVEGGYNLAISGGDFTKAFGQNSPVTGYTSGSLWSKQTNDSVALYCQGLMIFK